MGNCRGNRTERLFFAKWHARRPLATVPKVSLVLCYGVNHAAEMASCDAKRRRVTAESGGTHGVHHDSSAAFALAWDPMTLTQDLYGDFPHAADVDSLASSQLIKLVNGPPLSADESPNSDEEEGSVGDESLWAAIVKIQETFDCF